jgi:hypothetical protein
MEKLGGNPEMYFGMGKSQLVRAVTRLDIPSEAREQALRLYAASKAAGHPVVSAVFSHRRGSLEVVGMHGTGRLLGKAIANICSDARVTEEVPKTVMDLLSKGQLSAGQVIQLKNLVVPDAHVQKPSKIVFHSPENWPSKRKGDTFTVSLMGKGPDLASLLSAAYAMVNFGPHSSVNSLKAIKFKGLSNRQAYETARRLRGISGIKVPKAKL